MKHTLRCHGFGGMVRRTRISTAWGSRQGGGDEPKPRQPQGVAARIAAAFVARLANMGNIAFASLRGIANSGSHRTRVSSC
jgi:hypothetical protein